MGCAVTLTAFSRGKGACFKMTPSIALSSLYREALASLVAGESPETVLDSMVKKGLQEHYARNLVAAALIASTNPPIVCG
jgi:hypothetical protein